jgi:hypothetical protein
MAELPPPELRFGAGCPDCGTRAAVLPLPIPGVADDFDWKARDYDSFRLFMMQELASRFPERRRWTAADQEVVIIEALAAALDRASHALDRVQAERFIDSARRPASVRRLLKLIGWEVDPATLRRLRDAEIARGQANGLSELAALDALPTDDTLVESWWRRDPQAMEQARTSAPRRITEQNRMVTVTDHADLLKSHPLVALAQARLVWTGSWHSILIAALLEDNRGLDAPLHAGHDGAQRPSNLRAELWDDIVAFHEVRGLPVPPVTKALSGRLLLRSMIEQYRMIGSEVFLETARAASITVSLSVRAKPGYFRSELQQALAQVFTADQGGFFEPGRLGFGVPLYASDLIDAAMQIEGVAVACLNLFKRVGGNQPDTTSEGIIAVDDDEFIRCMNDPRDPARGVLRISVNGGEVG